MTAHMTIGTLARQAGLSSETLRYYERLGLIKPSTRSAANYRLYDDSAMDRLRFIRRAQSLGFSLAEIGELLSLHGQPEADMAVVKAMAEAKIDSIDEKIDDLRRMRAGLEGLTDLCPGHGSTSECPILASLLGTV